MGEISRYYQNLEDYIKPKKALIIFGPRRVGKTTLIMDYLSAYKGRYRLEIGDNISVQHALGSQDSQQLLPYAREYDLLVIDEAHKIPNIGVGLKILIDALPHLSIIATGSSSFELAGQIGEPLTGRKRTITLYPISQLELKYIHTSHELRENLEEALLYGGYPEIVLESIPEEKQRLLRDL